MLVIVPGQLRAVPCAAVIQIMERRKIAFQRLFFRRLPVEQTATQSIRAAQNESWKQPAQVTGVVVIERWWP